MAIMEVIDPPGELMYIVISRSGSMASRVSNCAMTSFAEASSIWTPRKMIRSSKSLLYGFISLTPYEVRSTNDGSTYLDCGVRVGSVTFKLLSLVVLRTDGRNIGGGDHLVDEAGLLGFFGRVPAVPVSVLLDLLNGLAGVEGGAVEQRLLHVEHLLGLDPDVGGRAA